MNGFALARASSLASRLSAVVGRRASARTHDGRVAAIPVFSSRVRARGWNANAPWSRHAGRGVAVPARAASPAGGGGGGGGFLPNAPRNVPPPTPKRSGPRPTKKRFNGDDALAPRDVKEKRDEGMRLSKALAMLGVASRRGAEEIIFAGRVTVNGALVEQPQHAVSPSRDVIAVDGRAVDGGLAADSAHRYFALNKPKGYLCSNKPGKATTGIGENKLVLDLFEDYRAAWRKKHPGKLPPRLFTVGRLDVNTTGLLLVTTDGQWCQRVAHPSAEIVKSYVLTASARPTKAQVKRMAEGCVVDGKKVTPRRVESLENAKDGGPANRVLVDVVDGRNREVRELAAAAGVGVKKLKRVRVGGLRMPGELPLGKYMTLKPHQVAYVLDRGLANNERAGEETGRGMGKSF
jgi:pseudouridine synthase